ncbi:hypothetical protein [Sinorhizobium meliloti]
MSLWASVASWLCLFDIPCYTNESRLVANMTDYLKTNRQPYVAVG